MLPLLTFFQVAEACSPAELSGARGCKGWLPGFCSHAVGIAVKEADWPVRAGASRTRM